jgi:predicted MFS family arabinose efflux permease
MLTRSLLFNRKSKSKMASTFRLLSRLALVFIAVLLACGGYGLWFTYTTEAPPEIAAQTNELKQVSWWAVGLGIACGLVWTRNRMH